MTKEYYEEYTDAKGVVHYRLAPNDEFCVRRSSLDVMLHAVGRAIGITRRCKLYAHLNLSMPHVSRMRHGVAISAETLMAMHEASGLSFEYLRKLGKLEPYTGREQPVKHRAGVSVIQTSL